MPQTKKTRKEYIDEMTRRLILEAGLDILLKDGLDGFTMDRVAKGAGIAKGTLYLYFDDKPTLLKGTIAKGLEPLFKQAGALLEGDLRPDEKLKAFLLSGTLFFEQQKQLMTIALFHSESEKIYLLDEDSPYYKLVERVAKVLEDGIDQGLFKSLDPTAVAHMLLNAKGSLIRQSLLGKMTNTPQENAELILSVFLNGISV